MRLDKKGEAEAELKQALAIARQQEARWWELRAATTLARHWHDEGRSFEAISLLQPIYSWFVEGFETADLKCAKTLLDQLRIVSSPQIQAASGSSLDSAGLNRGHALRDWP